MPDAQSPNQNPLSPIENRSEVIQLLRVAQHTTETEDQTSIMNDRFRFSSY